MRIKGRSVLSFNHGKNYREGRAGPRLIIAGRLLMILLPVIILLAMALPLQAEEPSGPAPAASSPGAGTAEKKEFFIEIRISRETLVLYEKGEDGKWASVRQYTIGTAVRGLSIYPLGKGKVTAITLNPWWYPTTYSRQVFRERGIDLPRAVPPGVPLNYMGPVKISLSHRTRKGAIYRIHGNNNPGRVGKRVTGGCFVMFNEDILELARTISVGTEVNILP